VLSRRRQDRGEGVRAPTIRSCSPLAHGLDDRRLAQLARSRATVVLTVLVNGSLLRPTPWPAAPPPKRPVRRRPAGTRAARTPSGSGSGSVTLGRRRVGPGQAASRHAGASSGWPDRLACPALAHGPRARRIRTVWADSHRLQLQALDALADRAGGGEHQHPDLGVLLGDASTHLVAVDAGQVTVEHDHGRRGSGRRAIGASAPSSDRSTAMPSRRRPSATARASRSWSSTTSTLISLHSIAQPR